jgi:hypothetical protein
MSIALRVAVAVILFRVHDVDAESELSTNTALTLQFTGKCSTETKNPNNGSNSSSIINYTLIAVDVNTSFVGSNTGDWPSWGDPTTFWQYRVAKALLAYGSPPLLVLATVGNTMSIIILQQPAFRKSSTSFILCALALVDLLYVAVGLTRQWILNLFDYDLRLNTRIACKTHIFFIYFLQMVWQVSLHHSLS